MSISPQAGHPAVETLFPNIHIAGQVPTPAGSLALASTLPYLKENLPFEMQNPNALLHVQVLCIWPHYR